MAEIAPLQVGIMTLFDLSPDLKSERQLVEEWLQQVRLADEMGIDAAWAAEHHFDNFGGVCPSAPMLMAAMAAQTRRIRIGSATVTAPFHNAIHLAEQMAFVDLISGGRLECGVGRGWQPFEFEGFGVKMETSADRTWEALAILRQAFDTGSVTYKGTYNRVEGLRIVPGAVQERVPIWLASGRTATSVAHAGSKGYHMQALLYASPDAEAVAELCRVHERHWSEAGHAPEDRRVGICAHVFLADTDAQARDQAREYFRNYVWHVRQGSKSQSWDVAGYEEYEKMRTAGRNMTGDYETLNATNKVFFGSPERVADQILWARETFGMTDFLGLTTFGAQPRELAERSIRLLAEEVMPRIAAAAGRPDIGTGRPGSAPQLRMAGGGA